MYTKGTRFKQVKKGQKRLAFSLRPLDMADQPNATRKKGGESCQQKISVKAETEMCLGTNSFKDKSALHRL